MISVLIPGFTKIVKKACLVCPLTNSVSEQKFWEKWATVNRNIAYTNTEGMSGLVVSKKRNWRFKIA